MGSLLMSDNSSIDSDYSQGRFGQIVRAALDAAATMDLNGVILDWNDAAVDLFDYTCEEAIGASLSELIVPERYRKGLASRLQQFRSGDQQPVSVRRFQTEAIHKDGNEIPVELSIARIYAGNTILFSAFIRDLRSQFAEAAERGQLAAIVDSSVDAIIGKDFDGIITTWNAGAEAVYGYSAEEAMGQSVSILIPDELSEEEPELREVLSGGEKVQSFEVVRRRKDGTLIDVSISVSSIRNDAGQIIGSATIERDITTDRANRIALEEREEQIRLLLESTAEAIYGIDLDGNCTFCNPACVRLLGYDSTKDLIGRNMHDLIHHKRPDGSAYPIEECLIYRAFQQGHGTHNDEEVLWKADGTSFPAEYWSYPIRRSGRTHGAVVTFVDISDRLQTERERLRLASLVESSSDPIVGLDLNGNIESWNDAAEQLFQYSMDEALGKPVDLFVSSKRSDAVHEAILDGSRIAQREVRCKRKNGTTLTAALTISPVRDIHDRHIGASVIARDVSRRKQRERELREARDAAETANQTKSEFLANISHELRTPMNAIIGMLELSLSEDLSQLLEDYLGTARDSAQTLLYLLNDLLDFSRMEAGKFELDPEPFSVRETLDRTAKTLSLRAHEKGLELACRVDPELPDVLDGDGRRLRQIVMNLVSNAIKFTEQGEIIVNVSLATEEEQAATEKAIRDRLHDAPSGSSVDPCHGEGTLLHFTVSDTGIGISPEDQQRIFAPFTQADYSTTRRFQGTGLGLAICRELAERMGGRIWVESESEQGSQFHFTVCCRVIRREQAHEEELRLTVAKLRDTRVLVVDDNNSNRRILDETLKQWRMRPFVVDSAEEALEELRCAAESDRPYPVVLVDALMPDVDGFMLIQDARKEGLLGDSAILMLSSSDRQTFRDRCEDLRINTYLEKPVSQSDLLDAVTRVLRGAGIETEERTRMRTTSRPLNILVAEDTPANQKVVRAILEKRGHNVTLADNGREAVELLHQSSFDAVLMDVQMPTMDGYQATKVIRNLDENSLATMPIIAMTAHAMREDMQRCLECGMDAYISKPLAAEQLIRLTERTARFPRVFNSSMKTIDDEDDSNEGISSVWDEPEQSARTDFPRPVNEVALGLGSVDPEIFDLDAEPGSGTSESDVTGSREEPLPTDAERPVIDRERALKRMGGDEELLDGLIECFLEDAPELIARLDQSLETGNTNELARAAHSLKGLVANFEAVACRDAAWTVEQLGRNSDLTGAVPKINTLKEHVAALINALESSQS